MFNPYCRETKGCFNPTVRGEGGSGEGCGRRDCGCVRGVGSDFVRESASAQSQQTHRGIHTAAGIMTTGSCCRTTDANAEGTYSH